MKNKRSNCKGKQLPHETYLYAHILIPPVEAWGESEGGERGSAGRARGERRGRDEERAEREREEREKREEERGERGPSDVSHPILFVCVSRFRLRSPPFSQLHYFLL